MIFKIKATVQVKKKKKSTGKPFNPNFDGNLLAWYDGDTLNADPAGTWGDRSINNFDLTLFNNPTIVPGAINGHDALRFDGVNQRGENLLIPLTEPITIYIVFKHITFAVPDRIFGGISANSIQFLQWNASPELDMFSGNFVASNPNLALNNYGIFTTVFNGANSENRNNNNAAVIGNDGGINAVGLYLGTGNGLNYGNCEIAYVIVRNVADITATQNLFINYLKNRFAL